jgi:cobalt/nickel transport system ATP-binding protein
MIELENVSYSYEGHPALKGVDFKIENGESVCLLGPNGSGKSTLLKLINGLIFPSSGAYRFDGEEITKNRMKDVSFSKRFHQRVGFVFQDSEAQLFCSNVYDEVAFGPRQMGMDEQAAEKRVDDCLKLLHLDSFRDRQPYHLSGGEKKKVAIAATLALNPEVLVLDEPMNGLDPRTERWLAAFIVDLNKAGKTIITSTHNLELVQEISRRAVLFDETHSVAADLPTEKLLENIELLRRVNLVDEFYHVHEDHGHEHFHIHNY